MIKMIMIFFGLAFIIGLVNVLWSASSKDERRFTYWFVGRSLLWSGIAVAILSVIVYFF